MQIICGQVRRQRKELSPPSPEDVLSAQEAEIPHAIPTKISTLIRLINGQLRRQSVRLGIMDYLLYGATGYTGELLAREAARRGHQIVIAGRDANKVSALASALSVPHRVFGLENPRSVDAGIAGAKLVLHAAGPFSQTSSPMVGACLEAGIHYLDITGEISVFEALAARDEEAKRARVMLLPGVGFDVVPSDCLAAHLKRKLPTATQLQMGFKVRGKISHGTALTMLESIPTGAQVRRDGRIVNTDPGKVIRIDFGRGAVPALRIGWGDVSTAYYSTGIPNIEMYVSAPRPLRVAARLGLSPSIWKIAQPLMSSHRFQSWAKKRIDKALTGPNQEQRDRGEALIWGEVTDDVGRRSSARLRTPEGYAFTVASALAIVERLIEMGRTPAELPIGFQTPSRVFGADFVLGLPGVERVET